MQNKNGKEVRNRLAGRSPLSRRRSATDCTAIKKGGGKGEEVEGAEETKGIGGEGKVATISTHHASVMQQEQGKSREIQHMTLK
jgi:hypothetical protein